MMQAFFFFAPTKQTFTTAFEDKAEAILILRKTLEDLQYNDQVLTDAMDAFESQKDADILELNFLDGSSLLLGPAERIELN